MEKEQVLNAEIESTFLGYCDHGILTFLIGVKASDGANYNFGGYALDQPDKTVGHRMPTKEGFESIVNTMKAVGVSKWEDLPGKFVRIKIKVNDYNRYCYDVTAIGNLLEDKWFDIAEHYRQAYKDYKKD